MDPATFKPFVMVDEDDRVMGTEVPPTSFERRAREAGNPHFAEVHPSESAGLEEFGRVPVKELTPGQREDLLRRKAYLDLPLTDTGNGWRFAADHGDDLKYAPGSGWHEWDGQRWKPNGSAPIERAKQTTQRIRELAAKMDDADASSRLFKHGTTSQSRNKIEAMVSLARSDASIQVEVAKLDVDPLLFNVANGTLDLRTGELRPHARRDLLTKQSPVAYDPDATAPRWERFVSEVFNGDAELVAFIQRAVGYSLTADIREHCLFLLHGNGRNGKSRFVETVRALLGDYALASSMTTFTASRRNTGPSPEIARLRGARFVSAIETDEGARLAEAQVKELTGGDTVVARHLHKEPFEFRPVCKIWLAFNHMPVILGGDEGIWRRVKLVPFEVQFKGAREDKTLGSKLAAELPGILNWALEGCLDWQRAGELGEPPKVLQATEAYRVDMDPLRDFVDERCVVGPAEAVTRSDLWDDYTDWIWKHHLPPASKMSQNAFYARLRGRGFGESHPRIDGKKQRVFTGVGLRARTS